MLSLKVPVGDGWIYELKHDGFRIVALEGRRRGPAVEPERQELVRRNRRDPRRSHGPPAKVVLDGEAVAHCPKGLPDFNGLLGRQGRRLSARFAQ